MIISELINNLNSILADCGDVEVFLGGTFPDVHFDRVTEVDASYYHDADTLEADLYDHTGYMECRSAGGVCTPNDELPVVALIWTD